MKLFRFILFFFFSFSSVLGQTNKIVIVADLSTFPDTASLLKKRYKTNNSYNIKSANILRVNRIYDESIDPNTDILKNNVFIDYSAKINGRFFIWEFETIKPITINNAVFPNSYYLSTPGDSIFITFAGDKYIFSGKGAHKYQILYEIECAKKNVNDPVGKFGGRFISLQEYLLLNAYYDMQLTQSISILESNKSKLTKQEYEWIKASNVSELEGKRLLAFSFIPFIDQSIKQSNFSHTSFDLTNVWDSTMHKYWGKWIRKQNFQGGSFGYIEDFFTRQYFREHNFVFDSAKFNLTMLRKYIYYSIINNPDYKGLYRERAIIQFMDEEITQELGSYNWFAQSILKDYYSQPGFSKYKKWIKSLETKREYLFEKYAIAPSFELIDEKGDKFISSTIKGKFAVIYFWNTGCEKCKIPAENLSKLQETFKQDSNIVFLYVNVDNDKQTWIINKDGGVYVPKGGVHLHASGLEKKHNIVKDFDVTELPTMRFIDGYNKIVIDKTSPYAKLLNEKNLTALLNQQMFRYKDGPYVFNGNKFDTIYHINNGLVTKSLYKKGISVATDQHDKQLYIPIQKPITVQPSQYPAAEKMLVLSDIEGNFTAFRKLLESNKVIDESFNWAFGNGRLIFAGDMFDRGEQVTECLWLIYSLEEQAKTAGGYVHFILGNHEIMNLSGNDHYVENKYKNNYRLMGKTLLEVYNDKSVLGCWLRSKNIIEKIGDNLFVHAGISSSINNMALSLEQINSLARPWYDKSEAATKDSDPNLNILFNNYTSPFWYRHYYYPDYFSKSTNQMIYHATEGQLDSTCRKFKVCHIITGHTIVADSITSHYNGKVINTDTRHADGKSEALLIERGVYYRVNSKGNKVLLLKDEKGLLKDIAENKTQD